MTNPNRLNAGVTRSVDNFVLVCDAAVCKTGEEPKDDSDDHSDDQAKFEAKMARRYEFAKNLKKVIDYFVWKQVTYLVDPEKLVEARYVGS